MILVTGGTGLVGSHLILELITLGKNVRAIHRKNSDLSSVKRVFSYYYSAEEATRLFNLIEWVEADLLDIPALDLAFLDVENVYHSAALISFEPSDEKALRKTNIEGTANIVNLCISNKIKKLCYFSSIATMDLSVGEKYVTENFTWHPEKNHNEYAITKHGAETEVWRGTQEGIPAIILNPGVIIGPGNWNSGSGRIFKKIDNGLKYHFPKTTGFVGVWDVVNMAIKAMQSKIENKQFIIVAENISFKKVIEQVAESIDKPKPVKELRPWMVILGYFFQTLAHHITGSKRQLSSYSHKSLFEDRYYSNDKIKSQLEINFTKISEVIKKTGKYYLMDKQLK